MMLPKYLLALASDPNVHPEKFSALVSAYHDEQTIASALAFHAAFLKMQPEIPIIDENGSIEYRDGRRGTYATNEDIQLAILPILHRHGFSLRFATQFPSSTAIRTEGILTHKRGHSRSSFFESNADGSGGKTFAQARGSIMSYGHRYTTVDLLNLITKGADTDGADVAAEPAPTGPKPEGFDKLVADLKAADTVAAFGTVWGDATVEQRAYLHPNAWAALKAMPRSL